MALYGVINLLARNHWLAIINEQDRKIIKKHFPMILKSFR
jgi:hypothetical protein